MKRKTIAVLAAAGLAVGLSVGTTESASAIGTVDPYCTAHLYDNTQSQTPSPNRAQWCQVQYFTAISWGYTGPINGVPGTNTYKALQRYLQAAWGYTAGIDGVLGVNSYKAMQRAAKASGWNNYTGPIDGTMSTTDWQAWGYHVRLAVS